MGKGKKLTYNEVIERIRSLLTDTNFELVGVHYTTLNDKESKVFLKCAICGSVAAFRIKSLCSNRKTILACSQCVFNEKVELCKNEAKKYNKRSEFELSSNSEYLFLQRNGLLDKACSHMERGGNKYKRLIYSYYFNVDGKDYIYVGLTYDMKGRDKAHHRKGSTVCKFCDKHNINIPPYVIETDYMDKDDASRMEGEILRKYISNGYIPINKMKTGGLGGNTYPKEFTINELRTIASKYKNRSEWKDAKDVAYYFAERRGLLDEVIPKPNIRRLGAKPYYTYDKCKEIVNSYPNGTTLKEFYTDNHQCYTVIHKNGWNELIDNFINLK